jgi:putative transposase
LNSGLRGRPGVATRRAPTCAFVGATIPARSGEESELLERLKAIAEKTRHSYGSRRLATQLQEEGYEVGRFKGRRLMQQAGVTVAGRCRRRPPTTDSRPGAPVAPHLLERHCDVGAPNVAWCGDITYI